MGEAIRQWSELIHQRNAISQFYLGAASRCGQGVKQGYFEAIKGNTRRLNENTGMRNSSWASHTIRAMV
jgi:hypothetical protein